MAFQLKNNRIIRLRAEAVGGRLNEEGTALKADPPPDYYEITFDITFDKFVLGVVLFVLSLFITVPSLCLLLRCVDLEPGELAEDLYCSQGFIICWLGLVTIITLLSSCLIYRFHTSITSKAIRQASFTSMRSDKFHFRVIYFLP